MNISILGIDLAKNVFQLHGNDANGKCILRKRLTRNKFIEFMSNVNTSTIAMEACAGASYFSRLFSKQGHDVKLIAPQFVKPYVKTNKNDANDAEAIAESASRPSMRYVHPKTVEEQDIQCLHRIRKRLVDNKTALTNQMRGLLIEYGIPVRKGTKVLISELPFILENSENELTSTTRELLEGLGIELSNLITQISSYDKKLENICKENEICQRLLAIPGVGPVTSTAILSAVGKAGQSKNARSFAAWLGLTPKQASSGNKKKLLGISKRGDKYLRMLMISGAKSSLLRASKREDAASTWAIKKSNEMGSNKAAVALANKNARMIWAMLSKNEAYKYAA